MKHLALLGDSIIDNAAYVGDGLDVTAHLRTHLSAGDTVTRRAVDGSVVENVPRQALDLPPDVTHVVISVGGNDALLSSDILRLAVSSSAEVFSQLADLASTFEYHYREMLRLLRPLHKPTTLCTIYYPCIPEDFSQKIAVAALATFNDVIIKQAFLAGFPLIDLRLVCNEPADYANEIEPSDRGGAKIAATIWRVVTEHDFDRRRTSVYF